VTKGMTAVDWEHNSQNVIMVLSEQNLNMCVRLAGGLRRVLICSERKGLLADC
jgi:hypothetical protein